MAAWDKCSWASDCRNSVEDEEGIRPIRPAANEFKVEVTIGAVTTKMTYKTAAEGDSCTYFECSSCTGCCCRKGASKRGGVKDVTCDGPEFGAERNHFQKSTANQADSNTTALLQRRCISVASH